MKILSERTTVQRGIFRHVRRYLAGWHPHLGTLHFGLKGKETLVESSLPRIRYFQVQEVQPAAA